MGGDLWTIVRQHDICSTSGFPSYHTHSYYIKHILAVTSSLLIQGLFREYAILDTEFLFTEHAVKIQCFDSASSWAL